ncbi:LLM class flavin-dependent oxidoreductase [Sphingomonas sp. SUN019]|uniref:MupA/Atu3671 family FMN-dependent luciferase-like monooxygenase n=1 Tax=Sphingomonas sp. SUN019 TaxID=2937788 RepID=UPI002164C720|nr:MupA/Atu3671 family FMN-dependent luciferase-like monooxygenase [Sphingomonas sp. SUN019]UVO51484.1 LLM class flavin-dependent oxidoreductase [Sphingomonas sp. SUN019]
MTAPWRCVLIGSEPLLIECGTMLRERGHQVAAIVSRRAEIRTWAATLGIPAVDAARDLHDAGSDAFDYLFSITNLSVLSPDILALPRVAAINFHDGPLPGYSGLNTPVWALLNGETRHAVTWHAMTERVDAGDVLATRSFDIDEGETAHSLNTKCFAAAIETFGELIDGLARRTLVPVRQAAVAGRYFGRDARPPAAATIDWNRPAEDIVRLLRALDFGGHANPLAAPKLRIGDRIVLIGEAVAEGRSGQAPGAVVRADDAGIVIATATDDLRLTRLTTLQGAPLTSGEAGLAPGMRIPALDDAAATTLSQLDSAIARYEPWWRRRLGSRNPLILPVGRVEGPSSSERVGTADLALPPGATAQTILAAAIAWLARIADKAAFDVGFTDPVFAARYAGAEPWVARQLPLRVDIAFDRGLDALRDAVAADVRDMHRRIGHAADLFARCPELHGVSADLPVAVTIVDALDDATATADLTIAIRSDGRACRWLYADRALDERRVRSLQDGFATLLAAAFAAPDHPVATLPLVPDEVRKQLVDHWNATAADWRDDACLHDLFVEQAVRTPDAPAVTSRGVTLSYADLDARSNRLARHLQQLDVGPDVLVGLNVERSVDMLIALLAIHKAGGAYVPLDPAYPSDRIQHMIADSRAQVIVTQAALAGKLPRTQAAIVCIDVDWPLVEQHSATPLPATARPDHLAYVIYTSGSTGVPKGVVVEHRNVVNFFAGMDRVIEPGGTWLAVTSLSFDISVLEVCWTVARGCHVVVATGEEMKATDAPVKRPVEFSLFYFASADGGSAADQYRLLLEGARFADTHDFAAVWTPERHFHAFGGLYPNPSVTSAAIAAVTSRVKIRGGSVVVPLHHPVRVAEEWSLVDNLSNGRVGIAFASGWQPNDFVLRPESFADKSAALMNGIDTVRGLWRGEKRAFPGPLGKDVEVAIYPRPVQPELPFWITSAGNPDTFAAAGRVGANILTHLLGQTVDELAAKLAAYRAAWREAGHPGEGHVTLMLHSFVGDDAAAVRVAVRQPLTDYLRTSTNLVKEFAWSFPAFKRRPGMAEPGAQIDLGALDEEELAALHDFAFERYYETGGLFGTPAQCLAVVDQVRAAGVDEIGCLIDFGVPAQQVLDHLPALDRLRRLATAPAPRAEDETLAGLMRRHAVTHLQCTPSMAQMLVGDEAARPGLAALRQLLVGGEALPRALAGELTALVGGSVHNMYGPTETTIWSATYAVDDAPGAVPLGRPLANQQIYILDSRQQLAPPGVPGELVIGGKGVVLGYLRRAELTAERFVAHPFDAEARVYRTGDLARLRDDGVLEFLGRLDHQVKIRGHRIELGEIEAVLASHSAVRQAVVTVREDDPGDVRLVAYFIASTSAPPPAELRDHLRARLPEFMIPAHLVALPAFPQTPNGKIDRAALPKPEGVVIAVDHVSFVAPADGLEARIAAVWADVLKLPKVGTRDNFFDIGGHSLLAVQVHRRLRDALDRPLPLTDIFRFPTVETLSAHLSTTGGDDAAVRQGEARAVGRRAALQRRIGLRLAPAASERG